MGCELQKVYTSPGSKWCAASAAGLAKCSRRRAASRGTDGPSSAQSSRISPKPRPAGARPRPRARRRPRPRRARPAAASGASTLICSMSFASGASRNAPRRRGRAGASPAAGGARCPTRARRCGARARARTGGGTLAVDDAVEAQPLLEGALDRDLQLEPAARREEARVRRRQLGDAHGRAAQEASQLDQRRRSGSATDSAGVCASARARPPCASGAVSDASRARPPHEHGREPRRGRRQAGRAVGVGRFAPLAVVVVVVVVELIEPRVEERGEVLGRRLVVGGRFSPRGHVDDRRDHDHDDRLKDALHCPRAERRPQPASKC